MFSRHYPSVYVYILLVGMFHAWWPRTVSFCTSCKNWFCRILTTAKGCSLKNLTKVLIISRLYKHLGRKPWCFPKSPVHAEFEKYSTLFLAYSCPLICCLKSAWALCLYQSYQVSGVFTQGSAYYQLVSSWYTDYHIKLLWYNCKAWTKSKDDS